VRLGEPPDVADFALHGTVVVVLLGLVVLVVLVVVVELVELVEVVVLVVVVVPPPPPPAPEKLMGTVALSPDVSPKAITQESPAVTCAGVGGHG
jgi:hypothetical protein